MKLNFDGVGATRFRGRLTAELKALVAEFVSSGKPVAEITGWQDLCKTPSSLFQTAKAIVAQSELSVKARKSGERVFLTKE